jgi:hypothetical protein
MEVGAGSESQALVVDQQFSSLASSRGYAPVCKPWKDCAVCAAEGFADHPGANLHFRAEWSASQYSKVMR